jgi:hypothetical protein
MPRVSGGTAALVRAAHRVWSPGCCGPRRGPQHSVGAGSVEVRRVQRVGASRCPAGIIGAGRSWTAWMTSVLSIPRRYAEVIARSACPSWRWITSSGIPSRDISTACACLSWCGANRRRTPAAWRPQQQSGPRQLSLPIRPGHAVTPGSGETTPAVPYAVLWSLRQCLRGACSREIERIAGLARSCLRVVAREGASRYARVKFPRRAGAFWPKNRSAGDRQRSRLQRLIGPLAISETAAGCPLACSRPQR